MELVFPFRLPYYLLTMGRYGTWNALVVLMTRSRMIGVTMRAAVLPPRSLSQQCPFLTYELYARNLLMEVRTVSSNTLTRHSA